MTWLDTLDICWGPVNTLPEAIADPLKRLLKLRDEAGRFAGAIFESVFQLACVKCDDFIPRFYCAALASHPNDLEAARIANRRRKDRFKVV